MPQPGAEVETATMGLLYLNAGLSLATLGATLAIGIRWGRTENRVANLEQSRDELRQDLKEQGERLVDTAEHVGKIRGALGLNGH